MKLAIFGGSGKTGQHLVRLALEAGHELRVLARDPAKIPLSHERLAVVTGDVLDAASVEATVAGCDVVLSALGIGAGNPRGHITQGVRHIVAAMRRHGVRRLIAISSLGIGDSKGQIPLAFRMAILAIPVLRKTMADLAGMEEFLRGTELDWIVVRPGGLQDKPARGHWQVSAPTDTLSAGELPRADVAAFMLAQLRDDTYVRKTPGLT
jgi:putative NADH-flavin reductase